MFGDFDLLIWLFVITGISLVVFKVVIMTFVKEYTKAGRKAAKIQQEDLENLNMNNIGKVAGNAIASEVDKWTAGLDTGVKIAQDVLIKQEAACAHLPKEEADKILEPLRSRLRQAQFFASHKTTLKTANEALTAPLIGRFIKKIAGGFL